MDFVQVAVVGLVVILGLWTLVVAMWLAGPIDLIPEFLPVIGPLDDIVATAIVLRWVGRRVGVDALRAHRPGSDEGFELLRRLLGRSGG